MKERESQRKLRELERNLWVTELRERESLREMRELVGYKFFFFFYIKIPCNFFNIIRIN